MLSTMKWIGIGVGALFGVTLVMLVRSARGGSIGGGPAMDTGTTSIEAIKLTPDWEDADFVALAEIARKYRMNSADLLLVMASESGLKPQATYRTAEDYPYAVGLNQMTPSVNDLLGISEGQRTQIPTWPVSEQLPLVDKMWAGIPWTRAGRSYDSAASVYTANFAPARMLSRGITSDVILYEEGVDGSAYTANKGFDTEGKGNITIGDLTHHLALVAQQPVYKAGLQRLREATGDASLTPGLPS